MEGYLYLIVFLLFLLCGFIFILVYSLSDDLEFFKSENKKILKEIKKIKKEMMKND